MKLHPRATVEEAFRAIGGECVERLEGCREAVERQRAEGVHEMRVAIRRLRAAMSIFEGVLGDAESLAVNAELEWLAGELADARDYDVFVRESRALAVEAELHPAAMVELCELLAERRKGGFERAVRAVASARFKKLVGMVKAWLESGYWVTSAEEPLRKNRGRHVRAVAQATFEERSRKAKRKLRRLPVLEAEERHELRIALKKLRYASEFFARVFPKRAAERKRYLGVLRVLQDTLGELNDWAVHERIAKGLVEGKVARGKAPSRNLTFALGLVRGHEGASVGRLLAEAVESGQALARAPRFWR